MADGYNYSKMIRMNNVMNMSMVMKYEETDNKNHGYKYGNKSIILYWLLYYISYYFSHQVACRTAGF